MDDTVFQPEPTAGVSLGSGCHWAVEVGVSSVTLVRCSLHSPRLGRERGRKHKHFVETARSRRASPPWGGHEGREIG